MTDTPAQTKRIVILDGGFGGLYAALYLDRTAARDAGVEIMLIDPQNFVVFTPMLHEVASGSLDGNSIVVPIRQALRHVEFLEAEATAIDFATRTVTITYGLEQHDGPGHAASRAAGPAHQPIDLDSVFFDACLFKRQNGGLGGLFGAGQRNRSIPTRSCHVRGCRGYRRGQGGDQRSRRFLRLSGESFEEGDF